MTRRLSGLASIAATLLLICSGSNARASFTIDALVGGAPTGVSYVNFDNLTLGAVPGTSGGIDVSYTGTGQAVQGSSPGVYAAPFISNSNGTLFGDLTVAGPDATTYLTTGTGSVSLTFPGPEKYLGLLWGSVDSFNSLAFFDAANNPIGTITGLDVTASANGNQGQFGTFYVNINSTVAFSSVVASSTSNAFEFDNVAYNPAAVPEPTSLALFGTGVVGLALARRRRLASKRGPVAVG
jgi:hypothetical protein